MQFTNEILAAIDAAIAERESEINDIFDSIAEEVSRETLRRKAELSVKREAKRNQS